MNALQKRLETVPLIALIIANAVPLWGVLFFGCNGFLIVMLYWSEHLILVFWNALRIGFLKSDKSDCIIVKCLVVPFVMLFCGFLLSLLGMALFGVFGVSLEPTVRNNPWWGPLVFVQIIYFVVKEVYYVLPMAMKISLLGLLAAHGVSFICRDVLRSQKVSKASSRLVCDPLNRVGLVMLAVTAGALLSRAFGEPVFMLVALVILKTLLDIVLYIREQRKSDLSAAHEPNRLQ